LSFVLPKLIPYLCSTEHKGNDQTKDAVSKFRFQIVLEERGADKIQVSQAATERASDLSFGHRRLINKHTLTIDIRTAINRKRLITAWNQHDPRGTSCWPK